MLTNAASEFIKPILVLLPEKHLKKQLYYVDHLECKETSVDLRNMFSIGFWSQRRVKLDFRESIALNSAQISPSST